MRSTIFPTTCPCSILRCASTTSVNGNSWTRSGIVREPMAVFNRSIAARDISPSKVDTVLSRGRVIIEGGEYKGSKGHGQYLRRGECEYLV